MAAGNKNIIFTGYQSGKILHELYSNAYAFAHPSESEGLPMAVLEAAAYGLPIIASDIPAHKELMQSWVLIFNNKDVDELHDNLQYILQNPEEAEKIGKAGRKYVLENYGWDEVIAETKNLYHKIINLENCENEAAALQVVEL